jgi:hypothetical protein
VIVRPKHPKSFGKPAAVDHPSQLIVVVFTIPNARWRNRAMLKFNGMHSDHNVGAVITINNLLAFNWKTILPSDVPVCFWFRPRIAVRRLVSPVMAHNLSTLSNQVSSARGAFAPITWRRKLFA